MTARSPGPGREADPRAWSWALAIVAAGTLLRGWLAAAVPLFPDETYYWEWSRRLAPGYFDHPPAIAFLVAGGTSLLGPTSLGVRIGAVVTGGIASLLVVTLARRIGGNVAALRAAVILACMPLAVAGLLLSTPDAPLLCSTAITFLAVDRVLTSPHGSTTETRWWLVAGLSTGVGLLSKLTAAIVPVGIAVAFLIRPDLRRLLAAPGPWMAAVTAALVFLPFVAWNATHGWISFAFQLGHGLGGGGGSALVSEVELVAGQAALVSPILFVLMVVATVRAFRDPDPRRALLAMASAMLAGVFVLSAVRKPVEANWPALAYVPATVLLATTAWGPRGAAWLRRGAGLGAVLVIVVCLQAVVPWLPVAPEDDPVARAHGWEDVASAAAERREILLSEGCTTVWYGARTYQAASETAFHLPGHPRVLSTNLVSRPNQYDLWPRFPDLATAGDCLLLFGTEPGTEEAARALIPHFEAVRRGADAQRGRSGTVIDDYQFWLLSGWSGDPLPFRRPPPEG